ncbi:hypothetical protein V1512DRAFT_238880 [Lipomyces arxii]|uniref:uncharacterized protein n=1 Tax=Lipomyces arxii TaxID=56418 RepID=UPI0034CD8093
MSKRRPTTQINSQTYNVDRVDDRDGYGDDRHGLPEIPEAATPQVMATRKILQPRSRRLNGSAASSPVPMPPPSNPFQNISSATPPQNGANPFGFLSQSPTPAPASTPAPEELNKPFSSTEYVKFLKIRALNEKFNSCIADGMAKDALGDLRVLCKSYVTFFERIETETKEAAKAAADFAALQEEPSATSSATPSLAPVSVPVPSTPSFFKPATPEVPVFGSTPAQVASDSTKPATPAFAFGSTISTQSPKPSAPPAFSFGSESSSSSSSAVETPKPATPALAFSSSAPTFSFGAPSKSTTPESATESKEREEIKAAPVVEEDSGTNSDSDDDTKIEGPSFVAADNLLKATDSPFSFNAPKAASSAPTNGPTFSFSAPTTKPSSSPFKFAVSSSSPASQSKSTSDVSSSVKSSVPLNFAKPSLEPPPASEKEEPAKSAFSFSPPKFQFGASSLTASKPLDSETKSLKASTPPPSEAAATGSPMKFSSLGTSGASAGISPFSFTTAKTDTGASQPFQFGVSAPTDNNIFTAIPKPAQAENETESTPKPATPLFGGDKSLSTESSTPKFSFAAPTSAAGNSAFGGNTWTPEKGIKFGADKSATENKPLKTEFNNPLGSTPPSATPGQFSFGSSKPGPVGFSFGSAPSFGSSNNGLVSAFGSSAPVFSVPKPSAPTSTNTSAEEGDAEPPMEQIDLSVEKGPGEEDEDVLDTGRTKVFKFKTAADLRKEHGSDTDKEGKPFKDSFELVGLGNFRVLKHQTTGKTRILVRADGSGRVLINIGLRPSINYSAADGRVRVVDFISSGEGVSYILKVKTQDMAEKLKDTLEANKGA